MVFTVSGLRAGAAAFALGVALAGPQAAGVAAADRGDRRRTPLAGSRGPRRHSPAVTGEIPHPALASAPPSRGDESRSEGNLRSPRSRPNPDPPSGCRVSARRTSAWSRTP